MHELRTGLYADQFCSFLDISGKFLSLIRFANDLIHSTIGGTQVTCAISKNTKTCESG